MSKLKALRESKNISQAKLSEISGVNIRILQYYEQGYKDINKAQAITLYKIAQALECKIEDILNLETNLIGDDLSEPIDPELVPKLKKHFEQIKREAE